MEISVKKFSVKYLKDAIKIWNDVVIDGIAFPQIECLDEETGLKFFEEQSYTGLTFDGETLVGLYILHPNNIGRCGHICNASYAVDKTMRGKHIGEYLVKDCMKKARELDFKILQFNAVVSTNIGALKLYKKLGFTQLGTIPNGFLMNDGSYQDIIPHYIELI